MSDTVLFKTVFVCTGVLMPSVFCIICGELLSVAPAW